MTTYPKVGIIFLTYPTSNGQRDINRCLGSMERISYPKDRVELICVESKGNIGPLKDWFAETWMSKSGRELPRITYLFYDAWIGFAGNNNRGYDKARELGCDYVYLLNEDTDIEPDFLLRSVERAEQDPVIGYVQSLVYLGEDRDHANTVGNALHILGFGYSNGYRWSREQVSAHFEKERVRNPELEIGYASGAGVLCRTSVVDQYGLFDEEFFMYHEDTDTCLQARMRGYKIVVEPSSIIYHYYEFAKSKINYYWMERNRYVLVFSYYKWWTIILLSPLFIVMDLAVLAFSIKGGWADMKLKMYKDWFKKDFWKWIWVRRQKIQTARTIGDREFLRLAVADIAFQEETVKNSVLDYIGNPVMRAYWRVAKWLI